MGSEQVTKRRGAAGRGAMRNGCNQLQWVFRCAEPQARFGALAAERACTETGCTKSNGCAPRYCVTIVADASGPGSLSVLRNTLGYTPEELGR